MTDTNDEITRLLAEWSAGDETALERLMPRVTDELRRIAGRYFEREPPGHTLQPTALVNELYLRLVGRRR
ncbi:MAG: RNA polymerase subunit sigma-70, partial [bacterium]|nr:RNA polymerase subunit sigma-70 [bacterium]